MRAGAARAPHVKQFSSSPRRQAYAQQAKRDPAAYALLGTNPLPDTFHVIPDNPANVLRCQRAAPPTAGGGTATIDPTIDERLNRQRRHQEDPRGHRRGEAHRGVLAVFLTIASVLLIANTIRLSLFARRREVEVMKLVGATDWFIRWPFVIEGVVVGAAGARAAIRCSAVGQGRAARSAGQRLPLIAAPRRSPSRRWSLVLVVAGVVVSALGSGLSLRRFLRV